MEAAVRLDFEQFSEPDNQGGEPIPFTLISTLPQNPTRDSDLNLRLPRFVEQHKAATPEDRLTLPTINDIHDYQSKYNVRIHYSGPYRQEDEIDSDPEGIKIRINPQHEPFNNISSPDGADSSGAMVQLFPAER
jgi:hypothetical protein